MMRKLLYSFLFFISSKSFSKRSFTPSLGLLCIGMFFVVSSNYGQCSYPSGATQAGTTEYSFCIDNPNTITAGSIRANRYVVLNVISGFTYTFSGNIFTGNEEITLFNAANNTYVGGGTDGFSSGGNTNLTWKATFSGKIKILLTKSGCVSDNTTANNSLSIKLESVGNDLDDQTKAGTDVWRGHIYNWTSNNTPPGGASPSAPASTTPFSAGEYVGYYDVNLETIPTTYNFGGDDVCLNVFSAGQQLASIQTETFAVRYRMKSNRPAGCYLVKVTGDDGVRLYVDNVRVFNEWGEQSATEYGNLLVYLKGPDAGGSDLILDYYENGGANRVSFSITPFDANSNTIVAPSPSVVCSGTQPNTIDGSSYLYNNSSVNPTIKYQWQTAINVNGPWTDINGATLEDYRPTSTNPPSPIVNYYRRIVSAAASNASDCSWVSNVIGITTGISGDIRTTTPVLNSTTNLTCSSFTANWNSVPAASSYKIDVATSNSFSAGSMVLNNVDLGLVTSFNVTGLNTGVTYFYRIRAYNVCGARTSNNSNSSPAITTILPVVTIGGGTTVCQNASSPFVSFTNSQNSAITVTYKINGGANATVNVSANGVTNIAASTTASGTFTYNLVSAAYQAVPACTQTLTGSAIITVNPTSIGGTLSGSIVGCTASNGTTFTLTGNVGSVVQWESSTDNFNTPGTIIANTMTNLSVSNVSVTTYYRAVVKSGSCSTAYSSIGSIITGKVATTAATLPVCNGFTANWNKVPGATTYLLDVSTSNTFSPFVPGFNGKDVGDVSSFAVTGLLPNAIYYYRIHPLYSCGVYAVASDVISVTTAALPTVAAIGGGANSVCIGASTPAFTNSTSGGTWSITNVTGDANITPGGVVTGVASGTVTVGYTITNGSCSNTVTKSLTINPTNTVSLTSAIGTNAQTVCENTAITNISYATTGATGATVTGLPAGVIGDWSGNVVTISGTPTASSGSPFNYTVTLNGGCGNVFATGTITVNPAPTTPSITKNNDASCSSLGSITITGLSGNWTINQTGDMGARPFNGTSSNFSIQDLTVGTHYFTATNSTTGCTSGIATVKINDTTVDTEWDGSGWTNGSPDGNKRVTISSIGSVQPFSALAQTNIDACSLIITAGSDVIIPSGVTLTVTNAINSNGKLVFESGSSLLQGKDAVNTGDIVYKRAVSLSRYDVVYWSMPVTKAGFTMHDFSPNTLYDKYFYWDELNGKWVYDINGKEPMRVGEGYNIRAPQDHSITSPSIFTGVFTGVPNNGDINVAVEPNKWNFLGNPYPSAVDASDLILDTNKDVLGALYFWTHSQAPQIISGTNTYRYISSDYIVYNGVGSIRVNNPSGPTNEFKGNIAAGQGFFAMPTVSQIKFNNDLRKGSSENTQFYKTAKTKKIEKNRLWLNATNSQGAFKQMLIGYMEGATNDIDISYDAITMGSNSYVDLYSINNTKRLTIQGRALPFDNTEVIPLGFKCGVDATGDRNFTISIDHADGFFATQEVYLEDKALGIITDLRKENYTFTSGTGTYSNRFALRYTNKALGNDDFENLENNILVSVKDKIINVISSKETIKEISVYNIGAELLYSNTKVNASELQIKNLHSSDQVLLVNITLENGHAFTKKIIFSNL